MVEVSADWRPAKAVLRFLEKVADTLRPGCEFIGCHVVQQSPKHFEVEVLKFPKPEDVDVHVSMICRFFDDSEVFITANANSKQRGPHDDRFPFLDISGKFEGLDIDLWIMLSQNECCAPPMVLDCKTKEWTYRANHGCFHGNRGERATPESKNSPK